MPHFKKEEGAMPEDAEPTVPDAETGATPAAELGEKGEAALKAERTARRAIEKERNELAAKVKEFTDRDKSDTEKVQEQLAELTNRATRAERENARLAVIAEYQIPKDYQDLIRGDDEETLVAAAVKVSALIQPTATPDRASFIIPDEGGHPATALNGDGIELALRKALGIPG